MKHSSLLAILSSTSWSRVPIPIETSDGRCSTPARSATPFLEIFIRSVLGEYWCPTSYCPPTTTLTLGASTTLWGRAYQISDGVTVGTLTFGTRNWGIGIVIQDARTFLQRRNC